MSDIRRKEVRVKICGLRRPEDIRIVNEAMPDYAGFILAAGRRRTVTPEQMAELSFGLTPEICKVAVFLNQDPEWICSLAQRGLMDVIQLHGSECEDEILMLQKKTGKKVIKAFRIDTEEDVRAAEASSADWILLDHGMGGTGEMFDWSLLQMISRPFFLAGGLSPENVREAIRRTCPAGVDVSTGVESDGWKDAVKVNEFMRQVRG